MDHWPQLCPLGNAEGQGSLPFRLCVQSPAPLTSTAHHTLTGAIDRRAARLHGFGAWPQLLKGQKVACEAN
jgi:hypothetical protein